MKSKLIKISVSIVTLLLAAVILSMTFISPDKATAASRLFGIQNLVDELIASGEEYKMLEIVPDMSYASLGFLSSNNAPEIGEKVFASRHSFEDRKNLIINALTPLKNASVNYIKYDDNYDERLYPLLNDTYKKATISTDDNYYEERNGYFADALDVSDSIATFKIDSAIKITMTLPKIMRGDVKLSGTYKPQIGDVLKFKIVVTTTRSGFLNNDKLFQVMNSNCTGGITFDANSTVVFEENSFALNVDGATSPNIYFTYTISEADAGRTLEFYCNDGFYESNKYTINVPSEVGASGTYKNTKAPATNYDADYCVCDPSEAAYVWIDDASETSHNVYFNNIYYSLNYTTTGRFARHVLQLDGTIEEQADVISRISVETITPDQLNSVDFSNYKFLYISQTSALDLPDDVLDTFTNFSKTNDFTWETAYNIFEAATVGGLPVVIDRCILNDLTQWDTSMRTISDNPGPTSSTVVTAPTFTKIDVPSNINKKDDKTSAYEMIKSGCNYLRLAYLFRYYIGTQDSYLSSSDAGIWTTTFINQILSCGPDWLNTGVVSGFTGTYNQVFDYGQYGAIYGNVFINGYYNKTFTKNLNLVRNDLSLKFGFYWEGKTTDYEMNCRLKGLTELSSEIINDNFYNNSLGAITTVDYSLDGSYDKVSTSGYTLLRYIVNYFDRRLMLYKDKIRVLDIEPTRYSTLTVNKVKQWFGSSGTASKISDFEIVQMNTLEFDGKIEDLIENYDVIYIGSCAGPDNELGSLPQSSSGYVKARTYNSDKAEVTDTLYEKLIYSHVGRYSKIDSVRVMFKGLRAADYKADGNISENVSGYYSRYSGNDITYNKYKELTEYVLAGYPVIVSNKFFSSGVLKNTYIDQYSYLYKFIELTTKGGSYTYSNYDLHGNLITKTEKLTKMKNVLVETTGSMPSLIKYANMPRLSISLLEKPTEYSIKEDSTGMISSVTYLDKTNGKYYLSYTFEISNTAEIRPSLANYKVRIFTDTNADGKFNGLEELDDLQVIEADTGLEIETNQLRSGVRYTVTRELADNYIGLVPWKLVVELYEDASFSARTSVKGYTAIKATAVTIKVLQIISNDPDGLTLSTNSKFKKYFENVKNKLGYTVSLTTITNTGIVKTFKDGKYNTGEAFFSRYLDNFDMIIIGFQDCFEDIDSTQVMEGIQLFIKAGKSILFSHDTTSFNNHNYDKDGNKISISTAWAYHMNIMLRSLVGMDRFGITTNDTLAKLADGIKSDDSRYQTIIDYAKANSYDIPYMPDGTISAYAEGFDSYELAIQKTNDYAYVYSDGMDFSGASYRPDKITQVNDGQITTFPYDLNIEETVTREVYSEKNSTATKKYLVEKHNTLSVASTHAQYYQLNLDMDKDGDEISDLVVWYCLSSKCFDAVPNDALNGYYIYTVGNITYTGMGHFGNGNGSSSVRISDDEAKLFINCILASYRAGIKAPSVGITSDTANKNNTISILYRTVDAATPTPEPTATASSATAKPTATAGAATATPEIEFDGDEYIGIYAKDINIVLATKTIKYRLYYEISEAEYDKGVLSPSKSEYELIEENGLPVYLKAYSLDSTDSDYFGNYFVFDTTSPGCISTTELEQGIMRNDRILGIILKKDWINSVMEKAASEGKSAKLYFGAWSVLKYVENNNVVKETTKSFTSVTIKNRELFVLD